MLNKSPLNKNLLLLLILTLICSCSSLRSPDKLQVRGNKIVTPAGDSIILKGLALNDPAVLTSENEWNEAHFDKISEWNVNVVRIPVSPDKWRKKGRDFYFAAIDQAVVWAKQRGIYIIIDWHSMGNLHAGKFQRPNYTTTIEETVEFWTLMAQRYKKEPTIAFYEIFNEPTTFFGKLGEMSWDEWRAIVHRVVAEIRRHDNQTIAIVAGLNWAYDLKEAAAKPFELTNVAYAVHPYPQKAKDDKWSSMEEKWEKSWGFMAARYPLMATEFGYMSEDDKGAHIPCIGDDTYGKRLVNYFSKKNVHWTVWCFHWSWKPSLIDREYKPFEGQGQFFHDVLTKGISNFEMNEATASSAK